MEKFHTQALQFGAELILGKAKEVQKVGKLFEVTLANGKSYTSRTLVLTFGKVPRQLGIPRRAFLGRGVSTCATCDFYRFTKQSGGSGGRR